MIQTVPDTGVKKSNESRERVRETETERGRMRFYWLLTPLSARRRLSEVAAAVWSSLTHHTGLPWAPLLSTCPPEA